MGLRTELRTAARFRPADSTWAHAARAGLAVAIPLVSLVAAGHSSWAATATFGAFTALYGKDEPYPRRAAQLAMVALGLVGSILAGTLAALSFASPVVGVVAVASVGALATLLCTRGRVGPPAGLMFAFSTAVCGAIPAVPADLLRNAALSGSAALLAWLIAMSGAVIDPGAPRRLAVARALRAAAALAEAPPGAAGLPVRHQAALAVDRAWRVAPDEYALLVAHAETELSGVHGSSPDALRALAAGLSRRGPVPEFPASPEETGRRIATLMLRTATHTGVRPAPIWPAVLRVGLGALVAGGAAHLTGLGHPYWAAVSAVAVLQTASLKHTFHRALQRTIGTVAGLFLAAALVALPGNHWTLVAEIVAAQVIAEMLVVRNYGAAMLAITPLALLVGELGHPAGAASLLTDRLGQTALGCLLGLACARLIPNRAAARHLESTLAEVASATTAEPVSGERLARLVTTLRSAYDVASGEPGLDPSLTDEVLQAERQARRTLAALSG